MTNGDWMHVSAWVPYTDGDRLLRILRQEFDFEEVDWCVMARTADSARVDYDPADSVSGPNG